MILKTFLLIAILAILSGCASVPTMDTFSNQGLTFERKEVVLKNIPLPPDFVLVKNSFCHGTDSFRYGEFVYNGTLSVDDLYYYYQKQMPASFWNEVSASHNETSGRVKYENEYEFCTILLKEGQNSTEVKIIVEQKKA